MRKPSYLPFLARPSTAMKDRVGAITLLQFITNVSAFLALVLPTARVKLAKAVVRDIYLFDSDNAFDMVRDSDWDQDMKWNSAVIFAAIMLAATIASSSAFAVDYTHDNEKTPPFKSPQILVLLAIFITTVLVIILVPELAHSLFVKSETGDGAETRVAAGGYFAMATVVIAPITRTLIMLSE